MKLTVSIEYNDKQNKIDDQETLDTAGDAEELPFSPIGGVDFVSGEQREVEEIETVFGLS